MKHLLSKITLISLILVMVFSLVACTGENDNTNSGKDELATAKFIVTFDTQGGSKINSIEVNQGGYAIKPPINPTKPGYEFDKWFLNGSVFNFDEEPITKNLTLTATWKAKQIVHEVDSVSGTDFIDTQYPNHRLVCVGNIDTDTPYKYTSVYNDTQKNWPIFVVVEKDSRPSNKNLKLHPSEYFAYFYTLEFGKEVRISTWAEKPHNDLDITKDAAFVKELNKYTKVDGSKIYIKWHSQLPSINIKIEDKANTIAPDWATGKQLNSLKYHDKVIDLKGIIYNTDTNKEIEPKRVGYEFDGWDYIKDGKHSSLFASSLSYLDETMLDKNKVAEGEPESYTLTIAPKWRKSVTVETAQDLIDFKNEVYEANKKYNETKSEEDKKALELYCDAKITVKGSELDFKGLDAFSPMFTKEFPFKGHFIGVNADKPVIIKNLTLTNVENDISLFGYLNGAKISNFTFENVFFVNNANKNTSQNINVATLANRASNFTIIEKCNFIKTNYDKNEANEAVNKDAFNMTCDYKNLLYGVVVSQLNMSTIRDCNVKIDDTTFNKPENSVIRIYAGSAVVGGIAGRYKSKTPNTPETGSNVGDIRYAIVDVDFIVQVFTGNDTLDAGTLTLGGIVGELLESGVISSTKYVGSISTVGNTTKVGGLAGFLERGKIVNCYAEDVQISVGNNTSKADQIVYAGGLIGHAMHSTEKVVLSNSYVNFGKNEKQTEFNKKSIELYVTDECFVYCGALIGCAQKVNMNTCFAMVPVIVVNVFGKDGNVVANPNLDIIKLGYLYAQNGTTSNDTHCIIVMDDKKGADGSSYSEHIQINDALHKITLDDGKQKSNFNINLNVDKMDNTVFFDPEKVDKTDLYKRFAQEAETIVFWKWTKGSCPILTFEKL